jgi:HPt (histidine-containing phosphotransfer) domain-containing protein
MPDRDLILDLEVLDKLASIMPRDKLVMIATSYLNSVIARVGRISAMAAVDDLVGLARETHDLKSTSGSFGARRLQALAAKLETACHDNDPVAARVIAHAVTAALPDAVDAVRHRYPEIQLDTAR